MIYEVWKEVREITNETRWVLSINISLSSSRCKCTKGDNIKHKVSSPRGTGEARRGMGKQKKGKKQAQRSQATMFKKNEYV
jgi:hypothetical protein